MDCTSVALTVFFEGQFYVGLFERIENEQLSVCRVVFGAEPRDFEVLDFLLANWKRLAFSPPVNAQAQTKAVNPKRMQREIHRLLGSAGTGTKSQQALQLQREQNKLKRKIKSRAEREAEKDAAFRLRQEQKKEKHKGH